MATDEEIQERFRFHPADEKTANAHEHARLAIGNCALWVNKYVPSGREKALALTALQEAMMWANAAIAMPTPAQSLGYLPETYTDEPAEPQGGWVSPGTPGRMWGEPSPGDKVTGQTVPEDRGRVVVPRVRAVPIQVENAGGWEEDVASVSAYKNEPTSEDEGLETADDVEDVYTFKAGGKVRHKLSGRRGFYVQPESSGTHSQVKVPAGIVVWSNDLIESVF